MSDLSWFRRPATDDPGTLNATFQLLDHAVVVGRGEESATEDRDHARLLEDVAAFAGVLRGFGLVPGDRVLVAERDAGRFLVAALAALRIGAVVVTDGDAALTVAAEGTRPADQAEPITWEVLMKAGRTDPAGAADLAPDHPAVDVEGRVRTTLDLASDLAGVLTPTSSAEIVNVILGRRSAGSEEYPGGRD